MPSHVTPTAERCLFELVQSWPRGPDLLIGPSGRKGRLQDAPANRRRRLLEKKTDWKLKMMPMQKTGCLHPEPSCCRDEPCPKSRRVGAGPPRRREGGSRADNHSHADWACCAAPNRPTE